MLSAVRLFLPALVLAHLTATPAIAAGGPGDFSTMPGRSFADAPTLLSEAVDVLAKVLKASDLQRFTVLDANRAATLNAHAAWVGSDKILGTLTIVPGETEELLKAMPALMTGRAAAQCNGTFSTGATPDDAGSAAVRLVTTCRSGAGAPVLATYLGLPRKRGGIFVFGLVGMGGEAAAKAADASIRDAAFKVLAGE